MLLFYSMKTKNKAPSFENGLTGAQVPFEQFSSIWQLSSLDTFITKNRFKITLKNHNKFKIITVF